MATNDYHAERVRNGLSGRFIWGLISLWNPTRTTSRFLLLMAYLQGMHGKNESL